MIEPSFEYVAVQWAIWRAGGIAVPLCNLHPLDSLEYVIEDSDSSWLITHGNHWEGLERMAQDKGLNTLNIDHIKIFNNIKFPDIDILRRAMILYTSGTTNLPKGVVTTHLNIEHQIKSLVNAWQWQQNDHILNILPLHHVHGIINVLSCALWSGACCEFLPKFNAKAVWNIFTNGQLTLFMAVPTIYYKLITEFERSPQDIQKTYIKCCESFRLMVSGSAALPIPTLNKWQELTGQRLLERYGMTEIGMALSNPYRGERRAGYAGKPLDGVELRLVNEEGLVTKEEIAGEIQVKGPNVFLEYWQKNQPTADAFTKDGWFKTGDIAILNQGYYKILGRNNVDIIKSGGYKISALEIEDILLQHKDIKECGVVGLPNDEWGEIVAAALVTTLKEEELVELKDWLLQKLPNYKIPREYIILDQLPRNTLGKLTKKKLVSRFI